MRNAPCDEIFPICFEAVSYCSQPLLRVQIETPLPIWPESSNKGQGELSERDISDVARHGCINNKVQIVYIALRTYLTCQSGLLNLK